MLFSPRILVQNWRLKLAALGLSVFLWALVQTEPRDAETFSPVPVVVEVTDTAWAVSGSPEPLEVELRLSGQYREMMRLARTGTTVRVPVRSVGSRDTTITLRRDWVALDPGSSLIVESVSPSAVRVAFEPAVSRVVPVRYRTEGELRDELALASPIGLNPPVARIRGPASRVQGVDSLVLRPLDLGDVEASGVVEVAVDTTGLGGLRIAPMTATIGIRVEERVERTLTGIPVIAPPGFDDRELDIGPASVDVILSGARTLVSAVDPVDLRAWIVPERLDGMAPGEERRVPVRVDGVPELVTLELPVDVVTVRRISDRELPGADR